MQDEYSNSQLKHVACNARDCMTVHVVIVCHCKICSCYENLAMRLLPTMVFNIGPE